MTKKGPETSLSGGTPEPQLFLNSCRLIRRLGEACSGLGCSACCVFLGKRVGRSTRIQQLRHADGYYWLMRRFSKMQQTCMLIDLI